MNSMCFKHAISEVSAALSAFPARLLASLSCWRLSSLDLILETWIFFSCSSTGGCWYIGCSRATEGFAGWMGESALLGAPDLVVRDGLSQTWSLASPLRVLVGLCRLGCPTAEPALFMADLGLAARHERHLSTWSQLNIPH